MPFITIPVFSFVKMPSKSYGLFLGWIDEWYGSRFVFRNLLKPSLLSKLRRRYEKNGFKVMAGVINRKEDLFYFKDAGIKDIVTDKIALAKRIFR